VDELSGHGTISVTLRARVCARRLTGEYCVRQNYPVHGEVDEVGAQARHAEWLPEEELVTSKAKDRRVRVKLPGGATALAKDGGPINLDEEAVTVGGRRLREADAEHVAEETLRQVGRGRRSLTGRAEQSPRISIRLRPETVRALEAQAARLGKRPTQLARELLERDLA